MAPDFDNKEPGDEIVLEDCPVYMAKRGACEFQLLASHAPRRRVQRPDEICTIEITKPGYYME